MNNNINDLFQNIVSANTLETPKATPGPTQPPTSGPTQSQTPSPIPTPTITPSPTPSPTSAGTTDTTSTTTETPSATPTTSPLPSEVPSATPSSSNEDLNSDVSSSSNDDSTEQIDISDTLVANSASGDVSTLKIDTNAALDSIQASINETKKMSESIEKIQALLMEFPNYWISDSSSSFNERYKAIIDKVKLSSLNLQVFEDYLESSRQDYVSADAANKADFSTMDRSIYNFYFKNNPNYADAVKAQDSGSSYSGYSGGTSQDPSETPTTETSLKFDLYTDELNHFKMVITDGDKKYYVYDQKSYPELVSMYEDDDNSAYFAVSAVISNTYGDIDINPTLIKDMVEASEEDMAKIFNQGIITIGDKNYQMKADVSDKLSISDMTQEQFKKTITDTLNEKGVIILNTVECDETGTDKKYYNHKVTITGIDETGKLIINDSSDCKNNPESYRTLTIDQYYTKYINQTKIPEGNDKLTEYMVTIKDITLNQIVSNNG